MLNLDEIEKRANAATPGPWRDLASPNDYTVAFLEANIEVYADKDRVDAGRPELITSYDVYEQAYADAVFIAHAREDIPALIARVWELEAQNESLKARKIFIKPTHHLKAVFGYPGDDICF